MRVGLAVGAAQIHLGSDGWVELVDGAGELQDQGRGPWQVTASGSLLTARSGAGETGVEGVLVAHPVRGLVTVNGRRYRGAILLRPTAEGVTVVNVVDLETYLRAVVPREIGPGRGSDELEAVKAQAIAARTFAVRGLGRRGEQGFDYYGTVLDQSYGGADAEDPVSTRAIEATRGLVLVYNGQPIEAFYHATCGGRTAAVEEVWNTPPRPYLRSVSDARPGGGWYCEGSSRFRWTEAWTEDALLATLTVALQERGEAGRVVRVDSIAVTNRTRSGRAAELLIRTNLGEERVRGDSIRWVLRPEPDRILNSTAVRLEFHRTERGTALTARGVGWGHGVGMCQIGALGRARAGQSHREILNTYYPGARIARLYP